MLTSLQNPRVKHVARLVRDRRLRDQEQAFVIQGEDHLRRALDAGIEIRAAFVRDGLELATVNDPPGFETVAVTQAVMERMAYGQGNPAVIAVCRQPTRPLETIDLGTKGMLLVAVGSEKPGNLGAMLRTAAAAGCVAVLAAGPGIDLWNPNVIRNSAGAIFTLPTVVTPDAVARTWLDRNQVTTLATVAPQIPGAASLWEIDRPPGPIAVVVGPEHAGLDDHWLTFADRLVTIPQAPTVIDSLNAATAAAVVLFELRRRSHPPRPPACESSLPSTR